MIIGFKFGATDGHSNSVSVIDDNSDTVKKIIQVGRYPVYVLFPAFLPHLALFGNVSYVASPHGGSF